MSFIVKLRDVLVGRSDLRHRTPDSADARGVFRPGLGWELVEPVFDMRTSDGTSGAEGNLRYRSALETLSLALHAPGGAVVGTSRIEIVRDSASPSGLVLDVTFAAGDDGEDSDR
ncbi:MAG: hypothetical protein ABIZ91_03985 [Gemmatimonadaceae bacterium]